MNVIDIISQYLRFGMYDGLCHPDTECGCYIGKDGDKTNFHICGESFAQCEPAYKIDLPPGDERGIWLMVTRKDDK